MLYCGSNTGFHHSNSHSNITTLFLLLKFEEKECSDLFETNIGKRGKKKKQRELTIKLSASSRPRTLVFINNLGSWGAGIAGVAALQFSGEEPEAQSSKLLSQGDKVSKYWYLNNVDWAWCTRLLFQLISCRTKIPKSLTLKSLLFLSVHTASINF